MHRGDRRFVVRGIYDAEADARLGFQASQTFDTAAEGKAWYKDVQCSTNPSFPSCKHLYTTACDWRQVQELLLNPLARLREVLPVRPPPEHGVTDNRFLAEQGITRELSSRLDLPIHAATNEASTLHTLRYLFHHMRCGIFVAIRRGALAMFVPFVNREYTNTWGGQLELEGGATVEGYYERKNAEQKWPERPIPDKNRWWANGNIMCNVESPNFWGDSYLGQLRHMLEATCAAHEVPDVEFFINKRDFPQLKANLTEPYDFLFNAPDQPLPREKYPTYAPIASFFVSSDGSFADIPLVCTDDWETATGLVFPPSFKDLRSKANRGKHVMPWAQRSATAVFRGNSTGPGVAPQTNQRLLLAALSAAWAKDPRYNERNPVDGEAYLDAGVVGYNMRDRKLLGHPMTYLKPRSLGIPRVPRVPMYEQSSFKYQLYVDGHCAAMRYLSMIPLGGVILRVASMVQADAIWYWPLLKPYDIHADQPDPHGDHIPVKADLSDLAQVITWCKQHDAECQAIAANAAALYDRLVNEAGQMEYTALMLHEMAARFRSRHVASSDATRAAVDADVAGADHPANATVPRKTVPDEVVQPWRVLQLVEPTQVFPPVFNTAGRRLRPMFKTRRRWTAAPSFKQRDVLAAALAEEEEGGEVPTPAVDTPHPEEGIGVQEDMPEVQGGEVAILDAGHSATLRAPLGPAPLWPAGAEQAPPMQAPVRCSLWGVHGYDWFGEDNAEYTACEASVAVPPVPAPLANPGATPTPTPKAAKAAASAPVPPSGTVLSLDVLGPAGARYASLVPSSARASAGSGGGAALPPLSKDMQLGSGRALHEVQAQKRKALLARLQKEKAGAGGRNTGLIAAMKARTASAVAAREAREREAAALAPAAASRTGGRQVGGAKRQRGGGGRAQGRRARAAGGRQGGAAVGADFIAGEEDSGEEEEEEEASDVESLLESDVEEEGDSDEDESLADSDEEEGDDSDGDGLEGDEDDSASDTPAAKKPRRGTLADVALTFGGQVTNGDESSSESDASNGAAALAAADASADAALAAGAAKAVASVQGMGKTLEAAAAEMQEAEGGEYDIEEEGFLEF